VEGVSGGGGSGMRSGGRAAETYLFEVIVGHGSMLEVFLEA